MLWCSIVPVAYSADMRTKLGAQILRAAKSDQSLTDTEKLSSHRCHMLKKHVGFTESAFSQALAFSCNNVGIGVVFYAGSDLGHHSPEKIAQAFKLKFKQQKVRAEVFIKYPHDSGSAVAFFINGQSYTADWLGVIEALDTVKHASNEAKLIYFKNKQISSEQLKKWAKGIAPNHANVKAMLD